jgi:hypothetical protein
MKMKNNRVSEFFSRPYLSERLHQEHPVPPACKLVEGTKELLKGKQVKFSFKGVSKLIKKASRYVKPFVIFVQKNVHFNLYLCTFQFFDYT